MYEFALTLSVLCLIGVSIYFARTPAFSVFHPLTYYIAFHGLVFVVRPIVGYFLHYDGLYAAYQFDPSERDRVIVIFASNLGFLCFSFFCLLQGSVPMAFRQDKFDLEERRRLSQIFFWVVLFCAPIGIYQLGHSMSVVASGNSQTAMLLDSSTGTYINTNGNGYLSDSPLMLASMCALLIWLARFRPISWLPLIGFVFLRAGSGSRGAFVAAIVSAALFYFYEQRRRMPGIQLVLTALVVAGFFNYIGQDRGQAVRELFGAQKSEQGIVDVNEKQKFLEDMDFANMEFFEYLVYVVPQRSGTYDYFLDNTELITEPVPRTWWKSKPVGEPFRRIWLWEYGQPIGMTRSLPGEGWYALGWMGVAIWCSLWGALLGTLYRKFVESRQTTMQTSCYMIFVVSLIVFFRDGTMLTLAKQTGVYLAPVGVWYLFARYMGLPKAADLRRRAAQMARRDHIPTDPAVASGAPDPDLAQLPPAVARRRLALQSRREG